MNFIDFNNKFRDIKSCIDYVKSLFHNEIRCPFCHKVHKISQETSRLKVFHCNNCNKSFSIFRDTIFRKSSTDLRKWLYAINAILTSKKGISALQLQREISVTYKTAWRMLRLIRESMGVSLKDKFETLVEIDETYVGGKPRKENYLDITTGKKVIIPNKRGRGTKKTPVVGIKERDSKKVIAKVMLPNKEGKSLSGKQLFKILDTICNKDTIVLTDDFKGYNFLDHKNINNYIRLSVNHSIKEFSRGNGIHTNGIESFWGLLKRGIYGIYHHISVKYMQNYINEFCFRNNNKLPNTFDRLMNLCMENKLACV